MLKHGFSGILRDTHKNLQIFLEAFDLDEKKLLKSRLIELKRENNTIFLCQSQFGAFAVTGLLLNTVISFNTNFSKKQTILTSVEHLLSRFSTDGR